MPVYVYEVLSTGERLEVFQPMSDPDLKAHPESGLPLRKVFLPPNLGTKHTAGREKSLLDNRNVEKNGFTKYEKDKSTGTYHRVAGKDGPSTF
jgi:predicted nucleic acid-binding Zn ribbon protein